MRTRKRSVLKAAGEGGTSKLQIPRLLLPCSCGMSEICRANVRLATPTTQAKAVLTAVMRDSRARDAVTEGPGVLQCGVVVRSLYAAWTRGNGG